MFICKGVFEKIYKNRRRTFNKRIESILQGGDEMERQLLKVKKTPIELYKLKDGRYIAFAYQYYDTDNEIVGIGEADDKETAIKLAIQDLYICVKILVKEGE